MNFAGDMVRIVLNADCGTGHHVFADSANNGPRGKALIEEFIPYLESNYPADRRAREPGCSTAIRRAAGAASGFR